jgi:hypothetical protein
VDMSGDGPLQEKEWLPWLIPAILVVLVIIT